MSWWNTTQFSSLATNAIKNAQKKIDKVLDIPTEEEDCKFSIIRIYLETTLKWIEQTSLAKLTTERH